MLSSFITARVVTPLMALTLAACTTTAFDTSDTSPAAPADDSSPVTQEPRGPSRPAEPRVEEPTPDPAKPPPTSSASHDEVVGVYMTDHQGGRWMCTGTVISPTEVITAAHCLDPAEFARYEVVAPALSTTRAYRGASVRIFGGSYEAVENPDLGVLTMRDAIPLGTYAELLDVVKQVDEGSGVTGTALVRTDEDADAPFAPTGPLVVSSTVSYGYLHGFGTPIFSKGGDSGAGLFLVENGVVSHKLIGVARQPEPARRLDHFTRVDAELIAWRAQR